MRFAVIVLALSFVVESAFTALLTRQSLPNCAVPCLTDADFGNCSSTDDSCLCHSQAFVNSTTSCIQASCTGSDLTNAEAASQSLCAAVGVTLTVSSATATATTASNGTATTAKPSSTNAASSHSINILTGAAAFAILAASL
ncbi:hypothetical protein DFJ58DRAFT_813253 [Suillus subalutaceus]|uniref:uncharacterized protein n=1 Tax=Suillus subalutaceus TaxID=48586 RepID=UPI001B87BC7E|nr:uncharacterized protein DFJ58DRAFT_813253 [Suillus subalutaceus]KAG1838901.1 hypothetical protein DFJ58DRAFT_813253 [Suillus subalutaceus]